MIVCRLTSLPGGGGAVCLPPSCERHTNFNMWYVTV